MNKKYIKKIAKSSTRGLAKVDLHTVSITTVSFTDASGKPVNFEVNDKIRRSLARRLGGLKTLA